MKIKKRFLVLISIWLVCTVLFTIHYFFVSNTLFYNAFSYLIPVALVVLFGTWLYSIFTKSYWWWIIPTFIFIYGQGVVQSFFSVSLPKNHQQASALRVITYNVGTFNLDRFHSVDSIRILDSIVLQRQKNLLLDCRADVVCLQEFYNNDDLGFSTILSEMASIGFPYFYINPIRIEQYEGFFGVITFSKFPIVNRGKIEFDYSENNRSLNTAIYTDIVVGSDTVKIINVHLHSMDLRASKVISKLPSRNTFNELDLIKQKMEYGFIKRGEQLIELETLIRKGGHIILVGDLNDLPFSFSYQTLKKYMNNAFEEAGFGFGFTYNKFPWFIRIDNQFATPGLTVDYVEVGTDNKLSDHFSVAAGYSFLK